jgi:hypothetical protein
LLKKIFVADPPKRIGASAADGQELMGHPWFGGVNWKNISALKVKPPFVPKPESYSIDPLFSESLGEGAAQNYSDISEKVEGITYQPKGII